MQPDTVALIITIVASSLGTVGLLLRQMNHLETRLEARFTRDIGALGTKSADEFKAVHGKLDALGRDVVDVRERLARVEGHLMAPEGFRLRRSRQPETTDRPTPEDPTQDHRETG